MATKMTYPQQVEKPKAVPTPKTGGYPTTGTKTSGIKIRGTGAATKGLHARGPMA